MCYSVSQDINPESLLQYVMSSTTTLAAFVKPGGGVELRETELPSLESGAVRIRMKASGVCGTDLEKLAGLGITSSILGHEVAGVVSESASPDLRVGDSVIPHHHVACNTCGLCKSGAGTMCEGFRTSNFVPGGFSREFVVPAYNVTHGGVHRIDESITFEEASFAEPLGCCIRGLNHAGMLSKPLKHVLVVGAGPIGLLHMELIRSFVPAAKIATVDMIESRLDFAERYESAMPVDAGKSPDGNFSEGALRLTDGDGFDLVTVATGSAKAFSESLKCVRKSNNLLLFGAPHKGSSHTLDLSHFFLNELSITSSYSTTESELKQAIELLQSKKIDVGKFITGKFPLEKIEEAMSSARLENQVKIIVNG